MLKRILLAILSVLIILLCVYYISEIGVLSPSQVDGSMVDTVVKVRGRVTYAVESPLGVGGMYLRLGDGGGEVDVRIQEDIWQTYDDNMKANFTRGKTVTAKGVLFYAGNVLVIVHGVYSPISNPTSLESD